MRALRRRFAVLPSAQLIRMVRRNILFAQRIVALASASRDPDPRALACNLWWQYGNGGGVQVPDAVPLPTDDAVRWQTVFRTRVAAATPPSDGAVFYPVVPLRDAGARETAVRRVRFAGSTDPSASYRTFDPYLAGARYQRLRSSVSARGATPRSTRRRA